MTRLARENRFAELEPLLAHIEHPARYLGREWGATLEQPGPFHVCMLYPDVYDVGVPNMGLSILYEELNAAEGISCERSYLPWTDMAELMRSHKVPLLSLESSCPVASFDVVGFTLAHERAYTNILECLDLAGIPLRAADRVERDSIVIAGGPSVWNCEPMAPVFDAVLLGDGEGTIVEICSCVRDLRAQNARREDILLALSRIQGVYVPSLYDVVIDKTTTRWGRAVPKPGTGAPKVVFKHSLQDFAATDPLPQMIVPYVQSAQDRLSIEVLRGCARGCRFCQAGMTYRPVRERPAGQVVEAARKGLARTGYETVSLTSLSTTDHSQCAQMLRELDQNLRSRGVRVSIPSQRMDAFGVDMARAVGASWKSGLTFAPEAGSQRLRDVINKNVTEQDIEAAARNAFSQGYRRMKLYFMMGLPTETDDDILGIVRCAQRVVDIGHEVLGNRGGDVSVSISVAVFIPKAYTAFQWAGQLDPAEVRRRQELLLDAARGHPIKVAYHDASASLMEGAVSKMGRAGYAVIECAWRLGCRFDAWDEHFRYDLWQEAARQEGLDLADVACESWDPSLILPWEHTSPGVSKGYLQREWRRAIQGVTTPDCTMTSCTGCGVCPTLGVHNVLIESRAHGAADEGVRTGSRSSDPDAVRVSSARGEDRHAS